MAGSPIPSSLCLSGACEKSGSLKLDSASALFWTGSVRYMTPSSGLSEPSAYSMRTVQRLRP